MLVCFESTTTLHSVVVIFLNMSDYFLLIVKISISRNFTLMIKIVYLLGNYRSYVKNTFTVIPIELYNVNVPVRGNANNLQTIICLLIYLNIYKKRYYINTNSFVFLVL